MQTVNIAVSSDHRFFQGLQTTLASIALHETTNPLKIHVLDGGLHDHQWNSLCNTVSSIKHDVELLRKKLNHSRLKGLAEIGELTLLTYARVLVPSFIDAPHAIYIDSDFLVTKPVSESLKYLDLNKAVCGCLDLGGNLSLDCPWGNGMDLSSYNYINGGFLLMNLTIWRENKLEEKLLTFLKAESYRCRYADQSAINWILKDDIGVLPQEWNVLWNTLDWEMLKAKPGAINIHYASGMKPWKRPLPRLSHRIWWLFNCMFLPRNRIQKLLLNPRNLASYVGHWLFQLKSGRHSLKVENALINSWKSYWSQKGSRCFITNS